MKTQSPDTSPEFEKVQFDLLRRAGSQRRLQLARDHIDATIRRARRRLARQHPEWSEREAALQWAQIMYGEELTSRVRAYMQQREASL